MKPECDAVGSVLSEGVTAESLTVPVIEERFVLGKREVVTDTILLRKTVHAHEQLAEIPLVSRKFQIERFAMAQVVDAAPPVRIEGDTTVYSVVEERLVKQLVVVEEIRVTVRESHTLESQAVTLLREKVSIEHVAGSEK